MVGGAADAHRVLLEHAEPGRRLARVDHRCAVPATRLPPRAAGAGDAAQSLQEVERGAFAGQEPRAGPLEARDHSPLSSKEPSAATRVTTTRGSSSRQDRLDDGQAAQHARRLLENLGGRDRVGRDGRFGGHVAAPDVLGQRESMMGSTSALAGKMAWLEASRAGRPGAG